MSRITSSGSRGIGGRGIGGRGIGGNSEVSLRRGARRGGGDVGSEPSPLFNVLLCLTLAQTRPQVCTRGFPLQARQPPLCARTFGFFFCFSFFFFCFFFFWFFLVLGGFFLYDLGLCPWYRMRW